jgi:NarL family two-component system response regulator LiaR
MTLLIVEDSVPVRQMIKSLIGDLADECYECDDGADALAAYAAHRPDWVLMDIQLTEVDGIAATRQIKAAWPEARIVIVTNYDDADLRSVAREAGAMEYVLKENLSDIRRILSSVQQGEL